MRVNIRILTLNNMKFRYHIFNSEHDEIAVSDWVEQPPPPQESLTSIVFHQLQNQYGDDKQIKIERSNED